MQIFKALIILLSKETWSKLILLTLAIKYINKQAKKKTFYLSTSKQERIKYNRPTFVIKCEKSMKMKYKKFSCEKGEKYFYLTFLLWYYSFIEKKMLGFFFIIPFYI